MNTSIDVQLHYGGKWLPGELIMGPDGVPQIDSSAVAACTKKQRIPKWWQRSFWSIRLFSRERDQSTLHVILETSMAVSAHRTRYRFNGRR